MTHATTWPVCDAIGCYKPAGVNRESSRAYGTRALPSTIVFPGEDEPSAFCPRHHAFYREWLAGEHRDTDGSEFSNAPRS